MKLQYLLEYGCKKQNGKINSQMSRQSAVRKSGSNNDMAAKLMVALKKVGGFL